MPALSRPADLPDFERPPINEVVLSLQFASLPNLRSPHIGLFWGRIRDTYPNASEQPPLPPSFETFGMIAPTSLPFVQIQALFSPPVGRFWFEENDGVHLLQIQQDRFVHNWRRREVDPEYPRYEAIRSRFEEELTQFVEFLDVEGLGAIRPNQCEVTYVNSIDIPGGGDPHVGISRITPLWAGVPADRYPLEFESATIQSRFILRRAGVPFGRVHVHLTPGLLATQNQPVIRLDIMVRAKPEDESINGALKLLDAEREVVVRTFAAVTTPEMWAIWGRTDGK